MINSNHKSPNQQKHRFLLTSKLYCGICGESMTGDSGTSRSGQVHNYYTCNNRKYRKTCNKERAQKGWIEQLVVDELVRLVQTDEFIDMLADKVVAFQERERDRSALDALEARQKENEKAIANMLAAIEAGIITPSTKSRLMELEAERTNIEKGITRESIADPIFNHEQIVFFLGRFQDGDIDDESYCISLIDTFLNSVFLYDDNKLVLNLNYSGEESKITLSIMEKAVFEGGAECSSFTPCSAVYGTNPNPLHLRYRQRIWNRTEI